MREFIIDTPFKLKGKLEMVATLGGIEIATKISQDDAEMQVSRKLYMLLLLDFFNLYNMTYWTTSIGTT
ncbi:hypothetical protein J5N97_014044 [Dioscorea zingiberensis]|uniref:Uncharacterized protein n=1 Tax=Dioscorea zingiberensis TaxID=325984 RepID=A0A9D5HJ48_9LILI|nr:hypothetical protein J5N97_014044 [Dioscorea zingiberensis]